MKKLTYLLVLLLILPLLDSASYIYKQNDYVNFRLRCVDVNGSYCNNSTQLLINVDYSSNGTNIINNKSMTFNESYFNYSLPTSYVGNYQVFIIVPNQANTTTQFTYEVSATGKEITISKAVVYILIFIISLLIFIALLILGLALPSSNKRDEITGYIIYVSNLKYVKMVSLGLAYLIAMFISFFAYNVCYAFLDMDFVTKMFYFIFIFQAILVLPLFILLSYIMIANRVKDLDLIDGLSRGLHMR